MPRVPALWLLLTWLLSASGGAFAQDKPSDSVIVDIAQRFIQDHFAAGSEGSPELAFDVASVHPGEDRSFWAVIGGFMAQQAGDGKEPHAYGLAMRLVCAEHAALKCWRLEKLIIDQKVLLDK